MNYGYTTFSKTFKENELHIINIIQSSRKNKLESPLNNLLHDYHKEGVKRRKNKEKLSINSSTGIFRKTLQKGSKSPLNKKTINHALSVKSNNNEINIRLSLNSDGNNSNTMNNTNSKSTTTYEEIIKEKNLLISKLKKEIKINNQILNKIKKKKLNIIDYNKFNLSKTKSSSNISSKNVNKGIFIFTELVNQTKRMKIHTPRYTSRIMMETENMKCYNNFISKKKQYNHRNFSGINSRRLTYHNSDSNLMNTNTNNNNKELLDNKNLTHIFSSILEKTKNICLKYKKYYEKNKTIN